MTETLTIKRPADIATVIPSLLGFHPADSIVILGLDPGSPTARVDICPMAVATLGEAAHHWSRVLLAVYSPNPYTLSETVVEVASLMPHVEVVVAVRIHDDQVFTSLTDVGTDVPLDGPAKPGVRILATRADLEAEASLTVNADEAFRVAVAAYEAGAGARAWAFLDRHVALGGSDPRAVALMRNLLAAVPPDEKARA